jgi:hypothetical protein
MKPWNIATLIGMLLSATACLSEDPSDLSTADSQGRVTESLIIETSDCGADFYFTCSDEPLVCAPGYGAVEFILDPSCEPFASHRVTCRCGSVDL